MPLVDCCTTVAFGVNAIFYEGKNTSYYDVLSLLVSSRQQSLMLMRFRKKTAKQYSILLRIAQRISLAYIACQANGKGYIGMLALRLWWSST